MVTDVRQPDRMGLRDQQTEYAVATRRRPDPESLVVTDAMRDELGESITGAQDTESAVTRTGQVACRHGDPAKYALQIEIGAQVDDGVEQRAQPFLAGQDVADAVEEFVQECVQADSG